MPSSLPNERSNVVVDIEIKVCVIDLYGHGSQLHSSLEKLKLRSRQIIQSNKSANNAAYCKSPLTLDAVWCRISVTRCRNQ